MSVKHATVVQVQGITLAAKGDSNHWVMMDGQESFGGSNAGSTPKELLLMALGGCTASDVISILRKKGVPYYRCIVNLTGTAREEHPTVFTEIHIEYVIHGKEINIPDVERAIELSSTKYCAVSAMLKQSVVITQSYRIDETGSISTEGAKV